MKRKNQLKIKAFTVFELTVVLALMSAIVTIISVALNRFNEQMKNNSEIHAELNHWYAFRSNLWNELYTADSVRYQKEEVFIFRQGKSVDYRVSGDMLERRTDLQWEPTALAIENITREASPEGDLIVFNFLWKGEIMELSYQEIPRVKDIIDHYFETADE